MRVDAEKKEKLHIFDDAGVTVVAEVWGGGGRCVWKGGGGFNFRLLEDLNTHSHW